MGRDNKKKLALGAIAALVAMAANADVAYEVATGVGHSDNISRVESGEIDETLASAGLKLDWRERTRRIEGDAFVDLTYVEYLENTYDGELLGTATGNATIGIVPERFTWLIQDNFGQARSDPFVPVTPDTRENINYFTTGPDYILRFSQGFSARVFGRYSLTSYEESPLDAERTSFGMGFGRELSTRSRVGLNFMVDDSKFDDDGPTDYERRSAYANYELDSGGRTTMDARFGYSWLEMEGADAEGGLLLDVSATRQLSASSALTLGVGHEFSDAGEVLTADGGEGVTEITASPDPFENSTANAEWRFDRRRTSIGVGINYSRRRYETQTLLDSTRMYYSADIARQMRPTLRLVLLGYYGNEDFENAGNETDDWMARIALDWRFGRHVGLEVRLERYSRSSTDGITDFKENRAYLGVTFQGDRAPGAPGAL